MCAYFLSSDSAFSAPKVTQYLNINNKNPPHFLATIIYRNEHIPHHDQPINQE